MTDEKSKLSAGAVAPAPPPSDMICEQHPELEWPHGDCLGPGCPLSAQARLFWVRTRDLRQQVLALEVMVADGKRRIGELEGAPPSPQQGKLGTEVLCTKCGGNGVIPILGGVSFCPRCDGRCYEPESAPAPPSEPEPPKELMEVLGEDFAELHRTDFSAERPPVADWREFIRAVFLEGWAAFESDHFQSPEEALTESHANLEIALIDARDDKDECARKISARELHISQLIEEKSELETEVARLRAQLAATQEQITQWRDTARVEREAATGQDDRSVDLLYHSADTYDICANDLDAALSGTAEPQQIDNQKDGE